MSGIIVTGGAGFIGSNFVKLITDQGYHAIVLDKLTYAADLSYIYDNCDPTEVLFTEGDINDTELVYNLLACYDPIGIVHFAAESHVDNSIKDSKPFIETNVMGTVSVLEATRRWLANRHKYNIRKRSFRFHHVSTDEVYGSLGPDDAPFTETTPYAPRSPYAASKAASDHMVASYGNTYGIPYVITNCSNNYGKHQHSEKLIPTVIRNALADESIPMYGDGSNIRDWIHVEDHCEALLKVFVDGKDKNKYNIGGKCQISNRVLIGNILSMMGKSADLVKSVGDRPGHDFRYDIDNTKIETELGWTPRKNFLIGLNETIRWYINENTRHNSSGGSLDTSVSSNHSDIEAASANL